LKVENVDSQLSTEVQKLSQSTLKTERLEKGILQFNTITQHTQPKESLTQAVHRLALEYNQDEIGAKRILVCEAKKYPQAKPGLTQPLEVDGVVYNLVLDSYNSNRNGTVDRTVAQINSIHYPEMHQLGLSEYRWVDGLTFMFVLIKRNGYSDYSASKECWSK